MEEVRAVAFFCLPYFFFIRLYVREITLIIRLKNRIKSVKLTFILPTPFRIEKGNSRPPRGALYPAEQVRTIIISLFLTFVNAKVFILGIDKSAEIVYTVNIKGAHRRTAAPFDFSFCKKPPSLVAWAVFYMPYLSLKNLIMSKIRAITPVSIIMKVKIPSYVTIVITSLSGATVRRSGALYPAGQARTIIIAHFSQLVNYFDRLFLYNHAKVCYNKNIVF